ncbi:VOC family protein [Pseudoroseicyclus sp. H15]
MNPQRINLITLGVADLGRAEDFYASLGWEPHPRSGGDMILYQLNGLALALFHISDLAADQARPDARLGAGAMTLSQNFHSEAEVDEAFELAIEAGAETLKAPVKAEWGGYSGYWADPDGHVWEMAYNPFWSLQPDGSLKLPEPGF